MDFDTKKIIIDKIKSCPKERAMINAPYLVDATDEEYEEQKTKMCRVVEMMNENHEIVFVDGDQVETWICDVNRLLEIFDPIVM